jgi:sulfide:quinone oxidoreductase
MRREDRLIVVTKDPLYHFVPSNPWVPVGWRSREAVPLDPTPTLAKLSQLRYEGLADRQDDPDSGRLVAASRLSRHRSRAGTRF